MQLDAQDTDDVWPPGLPDHLCRQLERLAATIAQARSMRDTLLPSDMKKDAKAIASAAAKLLNNVRAFSKNYGATMYENFRTSAIENINDEFGGLSEDALRRCGDGMDAMSLQYPLLGLNSYMRVLASMKGKASPRGASLERCAVDETARIFARLGLPTSSNEDGLLFRACRAVLVRSGNPKGDDALKHYMRNKVNAKT
jgi:hypothetical protein